MYVSVSLQKKKKTHAENTYSWKLFQKASIAEFSGCLENNSVIWHQNQMTKGNIRNFMTDHFLANAEGAIPH